MKLVRALSAGSVIGLLSGCYTLEPAADIAPSPGAELAFDINDVGRVGLGGAMGPEIAQVQGFLVSRSDSAYIISVNTVRYLRGGEQVWKGERVEVKRYYTTAMYERRYSKARTYVVGIASLAGLIYIGTRAVSSAFSGDEPIVVPPGGTAIRIP